MSDDALFHERCAVPWTNSSVGGGGGGRTARGSPPLKNLHSLNPRQMKRSYREDFRARSLDITIYILYTNTMVYIYIYIVYAYFRYIHTQIRLKSICSFIIGKEWCSRRTESTKFCDSRVRKKKKNCFLSFFFPQTRRHVAVRSAARATTTATTALHDAPPPVRQSTAPHVLGTAVPTDHTAHRYAAPPRVQ